MEQAISGHAPVAGKLIFTQFPGFARFIREHHLADYIQHQLSGARELNTPLLRIFGDMQDEQIIELSLPGHIEFLRAAEENRLEPLLHESMRKWVSDKLEIVGRDEIEPEDITQVSFLRKRALHQFLPFYTTDLAVILKIVDEIDEYQLLSDTVSMSTYIDILNSRISEHTHFIERIANTTPGIIYVFDLVHRKEIYSNNKLGDLFGYSQDELKAMGDNTLAHLTHPDDLPLVMEHLQVYNETTGQDLYSIEYRIRNKSGEYRWVRAHESVFRWDENGRAIQVIGISQDITEEKLGSDELSSSQEQLLEAQRIADMGSFEWDLMTRKINVSPQLMKVLDLDHTGDFEHFITKVHPGDKPKVKKAMEEAMEKGDYECEYRLYTSAGKERIIWSRGFVRFDDGKPSVFRGTVMDVTEKHHMVQRLQRSEELYKQAQSLSHIGNWAWDLLHEKLMWSEELYRIYELQPGSEISYDQVYSYNHPEDAEFVTRQMERSLKTFEAFDYKYRILLQDGKMKILHARGEVLTDEGKPYKLIGTLQDVTEQQLIERQLRENREFIQKIANTTPSLIASYNVNSGKYTFINQALQTILGYDPQEVFEKGVSFVADLIHPDDIVQLMEKNAEALKTANEHPPADGNEMVVEFKYRMRHRDGRYHWFHTFGTIFDRNSRNEVEHVLNVSIDITEQENAGRELYEMNMQLKHSNASLEEYAYVASHDLKEPLRKIATFSDRLLTSQRDRISEEGKLYLSKIIESSRRMQTMISDLLAVSVISGNKGFEICDLGQLLEEVIQTLEYKIEEKNAVLKVNALPKARVVPSQFRQLFQNLVGNALKFTPEHRQPEITIHHYYLPAAQVAVPNLVISAQYLFIEVADNGIGFDNQYANKIFTIFQRLHGKTEYEGTGIGLAICRKIAENHGGTIIATGIINEGATFTIIIPA